MEFHLLMMIDFVEEIRPEWVAIGADTGNNKLPEPDGEKVKELIKELEKITKVIQKPNLKRIII